MNYFCGAKYGKYILYELPSCSHNGCSVDKNVKIISECNEIEKSRFGLDQKHTEELLNNGIDIFVYTENNTHLGMMCGLRGSCYIRGPGIPLIQDNETVYWFWIFTLPEARGKGIFGKLRDTFLNHYNQSKSFTLLVDHKNTIMKNEMRKSCAIEKKHIRFLKYNKYSFLISKCCETGKHFLNIENGNVHNLLVI